MKTHHLIFMFTTLFIVLFYNEDLGLNLGILGIAYAVFTFFNTPVKNKTHQFFVLFATSILSGLAFAWYTDFPSFLALISSLLLLSLRRKSKNLKPLLMVPVFIVNCITFICRFFNFDKWLPERNTSGTWQKLLAVVLVPAFLVLMFFVIYTYGSSHFVDLFTNISWDINFLQLFCLTVLGIFIAFNYWNFAVERLIYKHNYMLNNEFDSEKTEPKPTYSFLDLDTERTGGVVSFLVLNILLVFFIVSYNYEQFYEIPKTPAQLPDETHERVNAVILSVVMVILVIMFYFKPGFNFDPKAKLMRLLAKIWLCLNMLLLSAMMKNTEYIVSYGITYKRLGVYAFSVLAVIGPVITLIKIQKKKTTAFLFNTILWCFYGSILIISFINWGAFITSQNIQRQNFSTEYHLRSVNFNEKYLLKYAKDQHNNLLRSDVLDKVKKEQQKSFLSGSLYYELVNTK